MPPDEKRRAQLWALFFGMQGLSDPPEFLRRAQEELGEHLGADRDPATRGSRVARRLQLVADGGEGKSKQRKDVGSWKYENETLLRQVLSSRRAATAIECHMGDPYNEIITLEDLGRHERSAIAAIDGVGSKTMSQIDEAFRERGLVWADSAGQVRLVAVARGTTR